MLLHPGNKAVCPQEVLPGSKELYSGGAEGPVLPIELRLWQSAGLSQVAQLQAVQSVQYALWQGGAGATGDSFDTPEFHGREISARSSS